MRRENETLPLLLVEGQDSRDIIPFGRDGVVGIVCRIDANSPDTRAILRNRDNAILYIYIYRPSIKKLDRE